MQKNGALIIGKKYWRPKNAIATPKRAVLQGNAILKRTRTQFGHLTACGDKRTPKRFVSIMPNIMMQNVLKMHMTSGTIRFVNWVMVI